MKKIAPNYINSSACVLSIFFALGCILFTSCSDLENERTIRWKFQNFDKLTYNYTQKTEVSPLGGIFSAFGITNTATGKLTITPTEDEKANLALEEMDMGEMGNMLLQNMKIENNQLADMSVKGLKPDGTIEGEMNEAMKLFSTGILPIPTKDLKVGESVQLEAKMPVPVAGEQVTMTGFQTLKLKSIEGNLYTLEKSILIDKYENSELEEKIKEEDKPQIKGEGIYVFDIEKGYFTEGEVVLKIQMKLDGLQKQDNNSNQANGMQLNFGNMKLNIISTVTLELQKEKE